MAFLYHFVPADVRGDILYPLNELKSVYSDLYKKEVGKYTRVPASTVMGWKVPKLGCLWNDVLHFSPVSPQKLKEASVETGGDPDRVISFYQVDPNLLDARRTVVYLYHDRGLSLADNESAYPPSEPDEIRDYDPKGVKELSADISDETKKYYEEIRKKGVKPIMFRRVTHVLYKGTLDISDLKIVSV
ncbi:MAG: hypothetical protein V4691_02850 [Pseudomonadota bacterium]